MTAHWSPNKPLGLTGPLERKDAEEVKLTPELKKMLDDLQRGFNTFKEKNDERLKAVEGKGVTDVVLKEHVDRINKSVGDLQEKLDQAVLESKRPRLTDKEGKELNAQEIEHTKAFESWFRKGVGEGDTLRQLEEKALSAGSNPDGGYLVPRQMETTITRVVTDISPVRSVAQVITIGTGSYSKPINLGSASSGWVGEASSRPQTNTPQLSQLVFPVHEIYAMPGATQTLLDDANINVEQWLADEVRIEFARAEGAAFVTGNGVAKPQGFMSYPKVANASYSWGNVGFILTGTANDFSADPDAVDDFIDVVYALKNEYRSRARWAMNRATTARVRKFRDGDDNYIWQPSIQVGQPSSLLGYPVVEMEDMASAGDGAYPVAFADWASAYLIVDRIGIRVLRDPFSAKPYVLFYTTKRVGGGIQNFEAIKLLKSDDA